MRILFDHCVDSRLRAVLPGHEVVTTKECGWAALSNGKLLSAAEEAGFDVFLTTDKNLRFQQNIAVRKLAVISITTPRTAFDHIVHLAPEILKCVETQAIPGANITIG